MSMLLGLRRLPQQHRRHGKRVMSGLSIAGADCMWRQLLGPEGSEQLRQLRGELGQRVLVVSNEKSGSSGSRREYPQASVAMSDREAELARRTWFELQKFDKQAIFLTLPLTPFPVERTVNDALVFCRRIPGGVTAIIAIGTGVTADVAKAVRALTERDISSVAAFDAAAGSGAARDDRRRSIPLVHVATTISPVPFSASWLCLHKEEDALCRRYARAADLVVFDDNILLATDNVKYTNFPESCRAYLLYHMFDCFFAHTLRTINSSSDAFDFSSSARTRVVESVSDSTVAALAGAEVVLRCGDGGLEALMPLCRALGALHDDIEEACVGRARSPPYLLDIAAYIKGASVLMTNRFSAPYSLVAASVLHSSLRLIAERDSSNSRKGKYDSDYKKSPDLVIEMAAFLALRALQETLLYPSLDAFLATVASDGARIDSVLAAYITASSVDVRARTASAPERGDMGAASLLEGLIIAEDVADETTVSILAAPAAKVGVGRGDVLKSDLVLSMCEEFF